MVKILTIDDVMIGASLAPFGPSGAIMGEIIEVDKRAGVVTTRSGYFGFRTYTIADLMRDGAVIGKWEFI